MTKADVASEWQIVGVVDDIHEGPLDLDLAPTEYFSVNQTGDHNFTLVVRIFARCGRAPACAGQYAP